MALTKYVIHDCRYNGAAANSGAFDPSLVGSAANAFTDGAATDGNTASPVFTSASYTFVAGDAGAWLFVHSSTSTFYPGWYQIASVNAGAATLSAAAGAAVSYSSVLESSAHLTPLATVGCASAATPTGAKFSIDYSQKDAEAFAYTDITRVSDTTFTSTLSPFGAQQIGNSLRISAGTNFVTGLFFLTNVNGVTATVDRTMATDAAGAETDGAGRLGGALDSPETLLNAASTNLMREKGNVIFVQYNASAYAISAAMATPNTWGADTNTPSMQGFLWGWKGLRTLWQAEASTDRPTLSCNADRPLWDAGSPTGYIVGNVVFSNINTGSSVQAVKCGNTSLFYNCHAVTGRTGFGNSVAYCYRCTCEQQAGTSTIAAFAVVAAIECTAERSAGGSGTGFSATVAIRCIAKDFAIAGTCVVLDSCVSDGCAKGWNNTGTLIGTIAVNCVTIDASTSGFFATNASTIAAFDCANYNGTAASATNGTNYSWLYNSDGTKGPIATAANPFTTSAGVLSANDYSPNTAATGGMVLRRKHYATLPGTATPIYQDIGLPWQEYPISRTIGPQ